MSDKKNEKAEATTPPAAPRRRLDESRRGLDTSPINVAVVAAIGPKEAVKPKPASTTTSTDRESN